MIEAVSTLSLQGSAQRQQPQVSPSYVPSADQPAVSAQEFVVSHVRVDNLHNVAILEYRSSKTGEIIRQYPSEKQISAYKRAVSSATIETEQKGASVDVAVEAAPSVPSGGSTAGSGSAGESPSVGGSGQQQSSVVV